ncbi:hypothetical protein FBU30_010386 [Linnemannia zychae]|nr:hypothetical protein FBU30_010386 [Linnemannia zychae]
MHPGSSSQNSTCELLMRLLGELPPQQVTQLSAGHNLMRPSNMIGLAPEFIRPFFQRHSSTLQSISYGNGLEFDSKTIQTILVNCEALESFVILESRDFGRQLQCLQLEDAIMFPWACSKLQKWTLTIAIPGKPFHNFPKGNVPYYKRPSPITLSTEEMDQLKALEALYRQIGALTELIHLDLRASYLNELDYLFNYQNEAKLFVSSHVEPGMQRHRKTRIFTSTWRVDQAGKALWFCLCQTEESIMTIGTAKVMWMNEHWLSLEKAHFFAFKMKLISPAFKWFMAQRSNKKFDLVAE